jgi:hypothetical protein
MTRRGESKRNPVMLSTFATLSVNSAKHLDAQADRPFAAAQGDTPTGHVNKREPAQADRPFAAAQSDTVRQLRLVLIG